MKEGDKNSKFFHISLLIERICYRIGIMKVGRTSLKGKKQAGEYFLNEFLLVTQKNQQVWWKLYRSVFWRRILENYVQCLQRGHFVYGQEYASYKALRPDGYQVFFINFFGILLKTNLYTLCKRFFTPRVF